MHLASCARLHKAVADNAKEDRCEFVALAEFLQPPGPLARRQVLEVFALAVALPHVLAQNDRSRLRWPPKHHAAHDLLLAVHDYGRDSRRLEL